MRWLRWYCSAVDALSTWVGSLLRFVVLALVVLGVVNVLTRYIGAHLGMALSSNAVLESQTQAFNLIFLLGAAWLLRIDGHIRVDIVRTRLSERLRIWTDVLGNALLLLPFCVLMLLYTWPFVTRAWSRLEVSPNPGGLPLYPIKTVLLIAFVLIALQTLSEIIKGIDRLRELRTWK